MTGDAKFAARHEEKPQRLPNLSTYDRPAYTLFTQEK